MQFSPQNPLYLFLFKSLALFILLLIIWYALRDYIAAPIPGLAKAVIDLWTPGLISDLVRQPEGTEFVTTLRQPLGDGRYNQFSVVINPLIYGYGLPLFAALMLASNAKGLLWKLPLGAAILIVPQVWGTAFDFLSQLMTRVPREVVLELSLFGWKREVIALCYQLGSLIFPVVLPVVMWVLMNRVFVYAVVFSGAIDEKADTHHHVNTKASE